MLFGKGGSIVFVGPQRSRGGDSREKDQEEGEVAKDHGDELREVGWY